MCVLADGKSSGRMRESGVGGKATMRKMSILAYMCRRGLCSCDTAYPLCERDEHGMLELWKTNP